MSSRPNQARRLLFYLCLLLFQLSGCQETEPVPSPPTLSEVPSPLLLNVGISSSAASLAALAEEYNEQTEQAVVNFVPGNSQVLLQDLEAGVLDALLLHQLPAGSELWYNPVALDGLVLVVHPDNPVRALTRAQVQAIYSGRLSNWRDLGGRDEPIVLVGRERGAGSQLLFNSLIMAEQRPSINMLAVTDNEALLAHVADDPASIGYTMMGTVPVAETVSVQPLVIEEVLPTPNSTGTQNYPLTVPIYFVSSDEPAGPARAGAELRAFLAWLQSPEGQQRIGEKYGRVR